MNQVMLFNFDVDRENNRIFVQRSFAAPVDLVWAAWTEAEILDQWWAPKPWVARTKSMDFREGGHWIYAMVGPNAEEHWGRMDYTSIEKQKSFAGYDGFCDSQGNINPSLPRNKWANEFNGAGKETRVDIELTFNSLHDLEQTIAMGFREGFTAGLENLDQYIAAQFYLKKENMSDRKPRVSSYINFPGTAEEAFNFYKKVFRTDFINGLKRFGDLPTNRGLPPVSDIVKKMVLHVELPLPGGQVLMGTDAPKEMGFNLTRGNNMHIQIEPPTKEEADRLFIELSDGGEIHMPIQEMFWGAYYGSFTDRFGLNWMINYQTK